MFRLLGLATLLLRPAIWLLIGAAFFSGVLYERAAAEARCEAAGGAWRSGLCEGVTG